MKFKIINRTKYRTKHLRSFVTRAYRVACVAAGKRRVDVFNQYRHIAFTITIARSNRRWQGGSTGHAYLNSTRLHVGIADTPNKRDFARVIAHEFGHCFGMLHSDMSGGPLWGPTMSDEQSQRVYGWADALPLERVQPKAKPKGDERRTLMVQRTLAAMARWQTKQKRARNALKKLEAKLKRLERQAKGDTP